MKKYLIITTALTTICFAPEIMAQCTENTDCASLGYTETSCPDGGLKCPLGNYWYCPAEQCSGDYKYTCTGSHETGGSGEACDGKYKSCTCASGYEWENGTCKSTVVCTPYYGDKYRTSKPYYCTCSSSSLKASEYYHQYCVLDNGEKYKLTDEYWGMSDKFSTLEECEKHCDSIEDPYNSEDDIYNTGTRCTYTICQ